MEKKEPKSGTACFERNEDGTFKKETGLSNQICDMHGGGMLTALARIFGVLFIIGGVIGTVLMFMSTTETPQGTILTYPVWLCLRPLFGGMFMGLILLLLASAKQALWAHVYCRRKVS